MSHQVSFNADVKSANYGKFYLQFPEFEPPQKLSDRQLTAIEQYASYIAGRPGDALPAGAVVNVFIFWVHRNRSGRWTLLVSYQPSFDHSHRRTVRFTVGPNGAIKEKEIKTNA